MEPSENRQAYGTAKQQIISLLHEANEPMSAEEIAILTGIKMGTVSSRLFTMERDGTVTIIRGRRPYLYVLAERVAPRPEISLVTDEPVVEATEITAVEEQTFEEKVALVWRLVAGVEVSPDDVPLVLALADKVRRDGQCH